MPPTYGVIIAKEPKRVVEVVLGKVRDGVSFGAVDGKVRGGVWGIQTLLRRELPRKLHQH